MARKRKRKTKRKLTGKATRFFLVARDGRGKLKGFAKLSKEDADSYL